MKITIINTSILTNFGQFNYTEISVGEAKELISKGFQSAVGHQSTCDVLNTLLNADIKMNRIEYSQQINDVALVFKLNGRPEEGKILTTDEIKEIGFSFGKLVRTA